MTEGISEGEFVKSWNKVIRFLISAETAWKGHRDLMEKSGGTENISTYKAQIMAGLTFNRSSSFFNAMEDFWPYCQINGGLREHLLPLIKVKPTAKENVEDE